jgi:hypothetical protein
MFLFRVTCFHLCKSYVLALGVFYMNLGEKESIERASSEVRSDKTYICGL